MIKRILAPTDGSAVSRKAVHFAAELAKQVSASLTLLGVIDSGLLLSAGVSPEVSPVNIQESTEDVVRQAVQAYLDASLSDCRSQGIEVSSLIRTGHPVEQIIQQAEELRADLVVMGSHGRSALRAAMLGSVAYGVLHKDAKVPVLIVRR